MVSNLIGLKGNAVANQFVIETENHIYFQSYSSVVAKYNKNSKEIVLSDYWNYSNTTIKYVYQFLRKHCYTYVTNKKDVLGMIKNGAIQLVDIPSLTIE